MYVLRTLIILTSQEKKIYLLNFLFFLFRNKNLSILEYQISFFVSFCQLYIVFFLINMTFFFHSFG